MVKRTRTKRRTTIYKVNIIRTHNAMPCSFHHCIVCTDYVYFVDRGSFFGPCSFDHCIVCTWKTNNDLQSKHKPYTQCNGQTNKDWKTNNDLQSKHKPYTQYNGQTNKDCCVYGLCLLCRSLFVFQSLFVWPLYCVYGLCLLCRSLFVFQSLFVWPLYCVYGLCLLEQVPKNEQRSTK
jgi:hypothetical protein